MLTRSDATPTSAPRCTCCGHTATPSGCSYCRGFARTHDGEPVTLGPGFAVADVWRGLRSVLHAVLAMLHGREYFGRLWLPVTANVIVMSAIVVFAWLVATPAAYGVFTGPWPFIDGWRARHAELGPHLWLTTTWLLLGPPALDVAAGALQEPIRIATERRMLGEPREGRPAPPALRLRERARVLAAALLAWPPALLLVLVPWIGPLLIVIAGAVSAAVVWFEPPMAARGLALPERLRVLWRNRWRALGAGAGLQLAAAVPFANLLALAPIATIAAATNYLHFDKRTQPRFTAAA